MTGTRWPLGTRWRDVHRGPRGSPNEVPASRGVRDEDADGCRNARQLRAAIGLGVVDVETSGHAAGGHGLSQAIEESIQSLLGIKLGVEDQPASVVQDGIQDGLHPSAAGALDVRSEQHVRLPNLITKLRLELLAGRWRQQLPLSEATLLEKAVQGTILLLFIFILLLMDSRLLTAGREITAVLRSACGRITRLSSIGHSPDLWRDSSGNAVDRNVRKALKPLRLTDAEDEVNRSGCVVRKLARLEPCFTTRRLALVRDGGTLTELVTFIRVFYHDEKRKPGRPFAGIRPGPRKH